MNKMVDQLDYKARMQFLFKNPSFYYGSRFRIYQFFWEFVITNI